MNLHTINILFISSKEEKYKRMLFKTGENSGFIIEVFDNISSAGKKIETMKATNEALNAGISATKPGNTADDVAQAFWKVFDKYVIE